MVSNNLVWDVVRGHNAFLVKKCGTALSKESGNAMNKATFTFTGFNKTEARRDLQTAVSARKAKASRASGRAGSGCKPVKAGRR
mmetsp:Transcript_56941/g.78955  ORF Transcript_56941/g.78955 Transcript_56941/m.78955 type:complete len:84 (-) Transcript_56941:61-312(-)